MRRVALKHLCGQITRGSTPSYAEDEPPTALAIGQACQRPGGGFDLDRAKGHLGGAPEKGRVHGCEVLLNSTGTGTLGRVSLLPSLTGVLPVFVDTHVTMLRAHPARTDARFLAYTLGSGGFGHYAEEGLSVGATKQKELNVDGLRNHRVAAPPVEDQRRIADFLDRECERIGAARDGLDRLAERALEPAVALAERAWGDHPLGKIGYAFEVQLGKMLYEDRIDHATAKPYLRIANVYWDRFELDDVKRMNFDGAEATFYALRPGDLLVCEGRGLGRSAVWDAQITPCYFQKALNRVRPYGLDSTRWVMWCLRVLNRRGAFLGDAPGVPHVTAEQLRATRIPLPDPGTQHRLVAEIDAEAERGKRLSALAHDAHGRLAEYRDALITEAVTGQLDVSRVAEAQLDERAHAAIEGMGPPFARAPAGGAGKLGVGDRRSRDRPQRHGHHPVDDRAGA